MARSIQQERGRGMTTLRYTQSEIEKEIGKLSRYAKNCHVASLAIVNAGFYPNARVARGWCRGVMSQHSWVAIDGDIYAPGASILDVTLWSYDARMPKVHWDEIREDGRYHPHGEGYIIVDAIPPPESAREVVRLKHLTTRASEWLRRVAPRGLDILGWHHLAAHAAVQGWPARDVYEAMYRDERTRALIPIDRVGMLTDINPGGLYLPGGERKPWLTPRCNVRKKRLSVVVDGDDDDD